MTTSEQARAEQISTVNLERAMLGRVLDTGSIYLGPNAQARADARCDALQAHLGGLGLVAYEFGDAVVKSMCGGSSMSPTYYAILAARAAFSAVPGLRGEDTSGRTR